MAYMHTYIDYMYLHKPASTPKEREKSKIVFLFFVFFFFSSQLINPLLLLLYIPKVLNHLVYNYCIVSLLYRPTSLLTTLCQGRKGSARRGELKGV